MCVACRPTGHAAPTSDPIPTVCLDLQLKNTIAADHNKVKSTSLPAGPRVPRYDPTPTRIESQLCINTIHQSLHLAHPPRGSLCPLAEHKPTHLPTLVRTCSHPQQDTTPTNQPCTLTSNNGNNPLPSSTSNREHNPAIRPPITSAPPQQPTHPRLSRRLQKVSSPSSFLTAPSNVPWTRAK